MAVLATMNLKQVQKAMLEFSQRDIRRISRSAVSRSATRIKTRVKQQVPVEQGNLKKSIKVKNTRVNRTKEPVSLVYSSIGYYNTLLYGVRRSPTTGDDIPISNPKGNWWDNVTRLYSVEVKTNISEFMKKGIRRAAAKAYTKTAISARKGGR